MDKLSLSLVYETFMDCFICNSDQNSKMKGLVKLMQLVKMAHSFLQPVSNLFLLLILSLPM